MSVSVKGPDGATVNFPDGTSPAVMQSAMASHYGGPSTPQHAQTPASQAAATDLATRWQALPPEKARALIDQNMPKDPAAQARYNADPRIQALTKLAGNTPAQPAPSLQVRQAASAQQRANQNAAGINRVTGGGGNFFTALASGVRTGLAGVPDMLAAGAERILPASWTGNNTDASYGQILDQIRANENADQSKSTAGAVTGNVIAAITGGGVAGGLVKKAAVRAAAAASPLVSEAGTMASNLMTLKRAAPIANTAKLLTTAAGAGAVQAAGTGEDPIKGAEYGAAGAAVLGGGAKFAQLLFRPVGDLLRMSNASTILSRLTTASRESIQSRIEDFRAANNGADPTVFEMLPLADRNKILSRGIVGNDNIVEQASKAIAARAANIGPEMSSTADKILAPQRGIIQQGITNDLTAARGGNPAPGDAALVNGAMSDSTNMNTLRSKEADAIMAPHNDTPVADNLVDLIPHVPGVAADGAPIRVATDPEAGAAIRAAAGGLSRRLPDAGVSAGDVSSMIVNLRKTLGKGSHIETANAQRAIGHLEDELAARAPEAADAHAQMTDAYAARSRMGEGMTFGNDTLPRAGYTDNATNNKAAQKVRNAFDTPEGSNGRVLGQSNKILSDLSGSPDEALAATMKLARDNNSTALTENLGADATSKLKTAAQMQDESAQALSSALNKASSGGGQNTAAEFAGALIGLHPGSFIGTKAGSIKRLMSMTHIPESRARVMVEMLFSQNPALQAKAIAALHSTQEGPRFLQTLSRTAGQLSGGAGADTSAPPSATTAEPNLPEVTSGAPAAPLSPGASAPDSSAPDSSAPFTVDLKKPYGEQVIKHLFPSAHINQSVRDPNSKLGQENPHSYHVLTQNAVDLRPIPGMTFGEFVAHIHAAGYQVVEAIDEVNHPSKDATGKHWHIVVA